jgi:hypothetical protein
MLIWSMRPHDSLGGFTVHGEGSGIFSHVMTLAIDIYLIWLCSYHAPGWATPIAPQFVAKEDLIFQGTVNAR